MLLVVLLCGLVSITFADPTMYGAALAKYPSAPVPYPANKYETPTTTYSPPNKYETPITTTTAKYETPKYEKKMEEYPVTMKIKYGTAPPPAMRYRRAADVEKEAADVEEEKTADPAAKVVAKKTPSPTTAKVTKLSAKNVKLLRDAVIESLLSDPALRLGLGFGGGGFYRPGGSIRPSLGLGFGGGYFGDEDEFF